MRNSSSWKIIVPIYNVPEGEQPPLVISLILQLNLVYDFRRNKITDKVYYKPKGQESWKLVDDSFVSSIIIVSRSRDFLISKGIVVDLFNSTFIKEFDPVHEYFLTVFRSVRNLLLFFNRHH